MFNRLSKYDHRADSCKCNTFYRMKYKECFTVLLLMSVFFSYFAIHLLQSDTIREENIAERDTVTFQNRNNSTMNPKHNEVLIFPAQEFAIKSSYLLENSKLCTSVDNLTVLIIIHTAPSHFKHRLAIRKTWANNSYYANLGFVRVLFLLGKVKNMTLQDELEKEFKYNADMLQGNFIDDYHNITYKGVMAYQWLTEKCRNAKIILKTDDDVIVDMFNFLSNYVKSFHDKRKYIVCRRLHNTKIMRNGGSKWHVENSIFGGHKFYPDYCQGFIVVISNDLIPALYGSSLVTPYFWVDDVFLYGLVPKNVSGIQYTNMLYGKDVIWGSYKARKCYESKTCPYLAVMLWSDIPSTMYELWLLMVQNYCSTRTKRPRTC